MCQSTIDICVTALLITLSLFGLIISIPSFISMYKLGLKTYRQQLRILKIMIRKVSTGYKITHNQFHFFPIVVDKNHLLILTKKEGPFNVLYIQYCEHKNEHYEWSNDNVEIKTSTCLLTQLLNDRLHKKVDSLMKSSVVIEGVENLNQLLNSKITSIKREEALNSILK
jgi:hypothetical protein